MKRNLFLRLCLIIIALLSFQSCQQDLLPEKETYNNSSAFQLTSKIISLNESKHRAKLLPELEKAEAEFKKLKTDALGKTAIYGNGVSIDTYNVTYIENGPNYHTYTFIITRENAPADAPLENLVLSPLTDGTYRELLFTYNLSATEKENIANGIPVDTQGKVSVTELAKGTYNNGGHLAKTSCNWVTTTVWVPCSENLHDASNFHECRFIAHPGEGTPPRAIVIEEYKCILESDPGPGDGPGGSGTGGGGVGGGEGGTDPNDDPCNGNGVLTNPQQPGLTDPNGCTGIPTMPTMPNLPLLNNPCEKTKAMLENPAVETKISNLYDQSKLNGEKAFMVQPDGTPGALIPGDETSVDLGDISGHKGYYHNHPADQPDRKGVKIHSVPDIYKLFEFIVNQPAGTPVNDSFAGMVTSYSCGSSSDCPTDGYLYINYLIRFNGTLQDAQAIKNKNYDFKALSSSYSKFEQSLKNRPEYASQYGNFMNFKGLEKVFFNALDKMEIPKNQITLQRIDKNGNIYNVALDASGTPSETPCP